MGRCPAAVAATGRSRHRAAAGSPRQLPRQRCHLGLQDQGRQIGTLRRWQKQAIEPILPLLEHRRRKPVAAGIGRQIALQLQDSIRLILGKPEKEPVAGDHNGGIWPDRRSIPWAKASGSTWGKRPSVVDLPPEPGESEPRKSGVSHQSATNSPASHKQRQLHNPLTNTDNTKRARPR